MPLGLKKLVSARLRSSHHQRGAAAILAMVFMMIFGSLAAAMAIVAQGNLRTADTHLKINRAHAVAESGMQYVAFRLERATTPTPGDGSDDRVVFTRDGLIDPADAAELWLNGSDSDPGIVTQMFDAMDDDPHYADGSGPAVLEYSVDQPNIAKDVHRVLELGEIKLSEDGPTFSATLQQHPIPSTTIPEPLREHYGDPSLEPQPDEPRSAYRYNRPPYDGSRPDKTGIEERIDENNPLDARFVRLRVTATVGEGSNAVTRTLSKDFRIDKRIPFAILSRSRVMIGRNVRIQGPLGSRFTEITDSDGDPIGANPHPIQMLSDFRNLDSELDDALEQFEEDLKQYDTMTPDNRLAVNTPEAENASGTDVNGDGYIDEFDYFLAEFDGDSENEQGHNAISRQEFNPTGDKDREELFDLMNRWATPDDDDPEVINFRDRYAKINGEVHIRATKEQWNEGVPSGDYHDAFAGMIRSGPGEQPIEFGSEKTENYEFTPDDLQFDQFRDDTEPLSNQAPGGPDDTATELVPYEAENPYDIYQRPVYENRTFENVRIPAGTNAVFKNCTFRHVTYIETREDNTMEGFDVAGTREASGFLKYPGESVTIDGDTYASSKPFGNNLRFHNCSFEGQVVTDTPRDYTHMRNKLTFTGQTSFPLQEAKQNSRITEEQMQRYRRSLLLAPQFSVEMGQVVPAGSDVSEIELTGTIIAGLIDMRGQIDVEGTIVTTYRPENDEGAAADGKSPWFNTTLGYFSSQQGDKEAGTPGGARGRIRVEYDPTIPLPDGINGPIEVRPLHSTYWEAG